MASDQGSQGVPAPPISAYCARFTEFRLRISERTCPRRSTSNFAEPIDPEGKPER